MSAKGVTETRDVRALAEQLTLILAWVAAVDVGCKDYGEKLKRLEDYVNRLFGHTKSEPINSIIGEVRKIAKEKCSGGRRGSLNDEIKALVKRKAAELMGSPIKLPNSLLHYSPSYCKCDELERAVSSVNRECYRVELRLVSRGLVGVSGGPLYPAFEVGISWHHLFDTPFIPSSSVKGALRHTAMLACLSVPGKTQAKIQCVENVYRLFGFPPEPSTDEIQVIRNVLGGQAVTQLLGKLGYDGQAGCLVFTDFMLVGCEGGKGEACSLFEPYVITPHYKPTSPIRSEYEAEPVPVVHLVLKPGLVFRGCICLSNLLSCDSRVVESLAKHLGVERTLDALLEALLRAAAERGIGARVTRGFSKYEVSLKAPSTC